METYGELKQALKDITLKQKGTKIGKVAIDTVLGAIPGIGAAKSTYDLVKAAFEKPDNKRSNTWLDRLDVDDEASAIIDDTVEAGFLKAIAQAIDKAPDNQKLDPNFDMNDRLINFLSKKYKGRTIAGVSKINLKKEHSEMIDRFQVLAGIKK